jgi:type II secretory pathway component PulK
VKHQHHASRLNPRRGVVLIMVLVIVTMVSLAGFGFLSSMSTEYEAAKLNGHMRQAQQTMNSAEATLLWIAELPERHRRAIGGLHHNPALFRSCAVPHLTASVGESAAASMASAPMPSANAQSPDSATADPTLAPDDRWRFSVVSIDHNTEQQRVLRFGLANESGKIHLLRLLRWEQQQPGSVRLALMQLPGMTESAADSILDWMDADDTPREFGAESEYYQALDRPYRPSNAVPQTLEELLYVKGVSRALMSGRSASRVSFTQPESSFSGNENSTNDNTSKNALPSDSALSEEHSLPWNHYLTIYSAERDLNSLGTPRIAINASTIASLEQQLSMQLPENVVRYILLAKAYGIRLDESSGVPSLSAPFSSSLPASFPITSLADLVDSTVHVSTPSGTIVVQSPLASSSPDFAELFALLMDRVSTQPERVIVGRVNVMLASESVLRMIPGMSVEQASQIVTLRATLDEMETRSIAWLLTRKVLDVSTFRKLFPEVTTGGDVFQAEIIVHRDIGGPTLRRNLVIDAAAQPARRVYWTDETDAPVTFPLDVLKPQM